MQYLWTGMALEEFIFFSECLYFSEYDTRMVLFEFWLRNRPSIKYVRTGGMEGSLKMCTGAYRGNGVEKSVIRYARTKWMPLNKSCGMFFV